MIWQTGALAISLCLLSLTACSKAPSSEQGEPRSFVCAERPLPEFTLGYSSSPTEEQLAALCDCIWNGLPGWAQRFSEAAVSGNSDAGPYDNSDWNERSFASKFGQQMQKCGGYEL